MDRVDAGQRAAGGGEGHLGEVGLEERQHRLGLGVTEADVVLDEARAVGGEHQPGEEGADVWRAGGGEVVEHGLDERGDEIVGGVGHRRRGVGAHAPGVRAGVALADALVVLGQRQRQRHAAVAQRQQRALRAAHPLLQDERAIGGTDGRDVAASPSGHGDALAGGESVELDDDGPAQRPPPRRRRVDVAGPEAGERRAGDAEASRQLPGVPLRRLQSRQRGSRAEARHARPRRSGRRHPRPAPPRDRGSPGRARSRSSASTSPTSVTVVAVPAARPGDRLLAPAATDDTDSLKQAPLRSSA